MRASELVAAIAMRAAKEEPQVAVGFGFAATSENSNFGGAGERIVVRPVSPGGTEAVDVPIGADPLATAFQVIDLYEVACFGLDPQARGDAFDCDRSMDLGDVVWRALLVPYRASVEFRKAGFEGEPRQNGIGHEYVLTVGVRRGINSLLRAPTGAVTPPFDVGTQTLTQIDPLTPSFARIP